MQEISFDCYWKVDGVSSCLRKKGWNRLQWEQHTSCNFRIWKVNKVNKLYVHMTVHRNKFLYNKTKRPTNFQIFSGMKLYMFRADSALAHVLQVWRQLPCHCRMYSR